MKTNKLVIVFCLSTRAAAQATQSPPSLFAEKISPFPESTPRRAAAQPIQLMKTTFPAFQRALRKRETLSLTPRLCEGMSFVNGAPWNTQDAVAERTEAMSP